VADASSTPCMQECLRRTRANAAERALILRQLQEQEFDLHLYEYDARDYRRDYQDIMEMLTLMYIEAGPVVKKNYIRLMVTITRVFFRYYRDCIAHMENLKGAISESKRRYSVNMAEEAVIEVDCYNCNKNQ
jgi:hypothetical protein